VGTGEAQHDPETEALIGAAYDELRRLARSYLRRERSGHTLQPTGLVNECYLRLVGQKRTRWRNRQHFVGIAAQLMRRVLREHARERHAEKRGGHASRLVLEDAAALTGGPAIEFLEIERALEGLAKLDPEAARVVELRFFGGLSVEEAAEVLAISPTSVKRHWTVAKAFLYRQLRPESP
jgi:RNA polymerase sigma factor (TIGR02999 family)